MSQPCVGQIGVGAVGYHFASHLLTKLGDLKVHDIDASRIDRVRELGATPVGDAATLAGECDTILCSLPDPGTVREVLEQVLNAARPDTLLIDCSTIDPETSRWISNESSAREVAYVEAPVTSAAPGGGSTEGARAGNVTFLVGGESAAVERAAPILQLLGERYLHLGPAGSGSIMKLVTNHVSGVITMAVAEGLVLSAAAGFPVSRSMEVIGLSVAANYVLDHIMATRVRESNYEPGFSVDLMHKDHVLAGELARKLTVPLPFNQQASEMFQLMRARGLGTKDHVFCAQFLAELAGVDLENGGKL